MKDSINMPFEEKRIGKHLYRVNMLEMDKWFELKERAGKLFLPVIAEAIASGALNNIEELLDAESVIKVDPKMIARIMFDYAQRFNGKEMFAIFRLLDGVVYCDNQMFSLADMNGHFPKHMDELIPFFVFAMGVQFKNFFSGLGGMKALVSSTTGQNLSPKT